MTQNHNSTFKSLFGLALLGGSLVIPASANLVTNGTFEPLPPLGPAFQTVVSPDSTTIPGWTVASGSVDWIGTYWQAPPVLGGNSIDLDGNSVGSISQTIADLTVGDHYVLSFALSGNPDNIAVNPKTLTVTETGDVSSSKNFSYLVTGSNTEANMNWASESFAFTASASTTTIIFQSTDTPSSNPYGPVIGAVSLTPEPGFYGLLALGLSGVFFVLIRRKRKA